MRHVYEDYEGSEIGGNVGHAVVVEEKADIELCPLKLRVTKRFEAGFTETVELEAEGSDDEESVSKSWKLRIMRGHSRIFRRSIPPVTCHKALCTRRLVRRSNEIPL